VTEETLEEKNDGVNELGRENKGLTDRVDELEKRVAELEEKVGDNHLLPILDNILDRINEIENVKSDEEKGV